MVTKKFLFNFFLVNTGAWLITFIALSCTAMAIALKPVETLNCKDSMSSPAEICHFKGVRIVLIDTGVAAFDTNETRKGKLYKHPDLEYPYTPTLGCLNMNVMDIIYETMHALTPLFNNPSLCSVVALETIIHELVTTGKSPHLDKLLRKIARKNRHHVLTTITKCAHRFSPTTLYAPDGSSQYVVREFLPTALNASSMPAPMPQACISHGTHAYGLLKGGGCIQGLCPQADVIMIQTYDEHGRSDKARLIKALQKAIELKVDIVICALKLDDTVCEDTPASKLLGGLIMQIPYVIAAAGNDGITRTGRLAYPARFHGVWSIGATQNDGKKQKIATFSQHEPGRGPHFVMPGVEVYSSSVGPNGSAKPHYTCMSGTSTAAVIFGGSLAIILSEAEGMLNATEIRSILSSSGRHINPEWNEKSLYGTLDMKSAFSQIKKLKK